MSERVATVGSEEETKQLAADFSKELKKGDIVELAGDLGSGKTFFARAVSEALGAEGATSPSFVIKNVYYGKDLPILHFDFYRLENPGIVSEELRDDLLAEDSLIIIEWADSIKGVLPDGHYKVHFKVVGDNSREITISR